MKFPCAIAIATAFFLASAAAGKADCGPVFVWR
jgi:hypothetical protein